MKSYLAGNPELRLALNEDLVIGKANAPTNSYGRVVLDDVSFHDCVNLTEFEHGKTLSFYPPDGEFVVLNYRYSNLTLKFFNFFTVCMSFHSKHDYMHLLFMYTSSDSETHGIPPSSLA